MPAKLVTEPTLKRITLRYLIAHAERPHLLNASRNSHLREFSKRDRFDDEFFAMVKDRLPEYSREMLYKASEHMPQKDFKVILRCFKEISGIWNPLHYSELGRVIPTTQDGVTTLASTMAGPKMVIKSSRAYNDDFNTDQEIILEQLATDRVMGNVKSTVQHYMLPSVEPHYLEMVTASLGYWEAIPRLWNWPIYGKTIITDVQIPLEDLIKRDYAYLNIDFEEKDGYILLNGEKVGIRINLEEGIEKSLGYLIEKDYLVKGLDEFRPIQILENFEVNGDLIFPEGTRYGSPCNRYELDIPQPNFLTRMGYTFKELGRMGFREFKDLKFVKDNLGFIIGENKEEDYSILVRTSKETIIADTLAIAQNAEVDKAIARAEAAEAQLSEYRAKADAAEAREETLEAKASEAEARAAENSARAEAAEAKQETLEARAEAAEAKAAETELRVAFERQISEVNQQFGQIRTLAHDDKNLEIAQQADINADYRAYLQSRYPMVFRVYESILESKEGSLIEKLEERIIQQESMPKDLVEKTKRYISMLERSAKVEENSRMIMRGGGIPINIETLSLYEVMKPALDYVAKRHPDVTINYTPPENTVIRGDKRLLRAAFTNLLDNAAEASAPEGEVTIKARNAKRADRLFALIDLIQTGHLSPEYAHKLSRGDQVESTKEDGNAVGANASYNIITGPHDGTINYRSLGQQGAKTTLRL